MHRNNLNACLLYLLVDLLYSTYGVRSISRLPSHLEVWPAREMHFLYLRTWICVLFNLLLAYFWLYWELFFFSFIFVVEIVNICMWSLEVYLWKSEHGRQICVCITFCNIQNCFKCFFLWTSRNLLKPYIHKIMIKIILSS